MKRTLLAVPALTLLLTACGEEVSAPSAPVGDVPTDLLRPMPSIVDGDNGGKAFFFWLRPIGDRRGFDGVADGELSPRVEICRRNEAGDACDDDAPLLASYTPSSGIANDRVRVDEEGHYFVNWHMGTYTPEQDGVYRIRVLLQDRELGHADVIALTQRELRAFVAPEGDELVMVSDRGVFRIAFRIEEGALVQEFCSDADACEADVETSGDGEDTSIQVQTTTPEGDEVAGAVTVSDGAFVDENGDPVEEVIVTAEVKQAPPSVDVFVDDGQELPYFVEINTFPEGVLIDPSSGGVLVEVCQNVAVLTERGIGPPLHAQLVLYKVSDPKPGFPSGETRRLPTNLGAASCAAPPPAPAGSASLLGMLRTGVSRIAGLLAPQPLVASVAMRIHGGLNTIIRDDGGSTSEPAFSTFGSTLGPNADSTTATVPFGAVGQVTTIDVQVRTGLGTDFAFGGDTVHVAVVGGPSLGAPVSVTDEADGTYTATYTPLATGIDTIAISLTTFDGSDLGQIGGSPYSSVIYAISPAYSTAASSVTSSGPAVIGVGDNVIVTFHAADLTGVPLAQTGLPVQFIVLPPTEALGSTGVFGPVTDHGDGTYSAAFTGQTSGDSVEISARVLGDTVQTLGPWVRVDDDLSEAEANVLLGSLYATWHAALHHLNTPAAMMSAAADAHGSSWRNWGMYDMNRSPRIAWDNSPGYAFGFVTETQWRRLYLTLAAARDIVMALDGGLLLGPGGTDNLRAEAYARFVQGLALGALALTYDQAFILDEDTDLSTVGLVPYGTVLDAALVHLDEALALANTGPIVLPAGWVGPATVNNTLLEQLIHSHKARLLAYVARTPAERAGADWARIVVEAVQGITSDFAVVHDGFNDPWWDNAKFYFSGILTEWARADYLWIGGADSTEIYQTWLATPDGSKVPFDIETDDRRITGAGGPQTDGLYMCHDAIQHFLPARGLEHSSNYRDCRFSPLLTGPGVGGGSYTMLKVEELELLVAEANLRAGDLTGATAIVNQTRTANGLLPPVTTSGTAGPSCVPRTQSGACGDLFEALKWEKRLEAYHYSYGTEFFDDRGWGDLVVGTANQLPIPGAELERLGLASYTFGGTGPGPVASLAGSAPGVESDLGYRLLEGWADQPISQRIRLLEDAAADEPQPPIRR